ncbi:MAG TPA: hypothetical protein VME46_24115, partial [Acidimicrobiales bacterium]|nr:hypothetical protein [Acidimicrobiales bacterium]
LALTTWYLDEGAQEVKDLADRHVAALHRIAIKERDAWYYPASEYTASGWPSQNAVALHLAPDPASFCGRLIMPLLRYHQATGNEQAIELCLWFRRLIVDRSGVFNPDGSFNSALAYRSGHFHTRLGTLEGLALLALHTSDHALTAFVKRSFDWALGQATTFGWTPGDLAGQRFEHETCSLVDMIGTSTALARAGHHEYWAATERFLRNHLAESQLMDVSWVDQDDAGQRGTTGWKSYSRVGDRVKGAFAGYSAPNDYVSEVPLGRGHTNDVQACCVGSGIRGLFIGWDNAIRGGEGSAQVNLLLSRATQYLEVSSHLPYAGRVDLLARTPLRQVRVRVPAWAGHARVSVGRGDGASEAAAVPPEWAPDGYLCIRHLAAGEQLSVTFPLPEPESVESAAGQQFLVRWRGDNVIGITPGGRYRPMYAGPVPQPPAPTRHWRYWVPSDEWHW